ncbi:MAG: glycosyltransferase family 39 protein [Armatimonadetes bacterium]|nr:glycosyltransferase family 39 protein [Armatimonadota bacterium]
MGERENAEREGPARRTTSLLPFARSPALPLLLISALGFCLRVVGLRWGLPNASHLYSYHPDEIPILGSVLQLDIFSGQLNPHFFNYGTVYTYLVYIAWLIAMGLGLVTVGPHTPAYEQLAQLHLVGRSVTVAFGVATILLVYFLARRITNQSGALLAAFLMAVVPGHVANSHYATVDVTLTFCVTLALLLITHSENGDRKGGPKFVFWSGVVVGLATATKYSAFLLTALLLTHCWSESFESHEAVGEAPVEAGRVDQFSIGNTLRNALMLFRPYRLNRRRFLLLTISACVGSAMGFLFGCPYAILAFAEFNRDFLFELHHSQTGSGLIFQGTGNGWWYHLSQNLPYAVGVPSLVLAIGYVWGLPFRNRQVDSRRCLIVIWSLLPLFLFGFAKITFLRYLLPVLPCVVVLLADSFSAAFERDANSARKKPIACIYPSLAAPLVIAAAMVLMGWYASSQFTNLDPRDAAAAWLKPRLHQGASVGLINVPWFYTPPICPFNGGMKSQRQFEEWNATAPHKIVITGWDKEKLGEAPPDYFVTSEFETRDEVRLNLREPLEFLRQLSQDYDLVQTFKSKQAAVLFAPRFVPHDWLYPNPGIRIYRKRVYLAPEIHKPMPTVQHP